MVCKEIEHKDNYYNIWIKAELIYDKTRKMKCIYRRINYQFSST